MNRTLLIISILAGIITCSAQQNQALQQPPYGFIRGTWITNSGSDVLLSRGNIKKAVKTCKAAGINNIYMVTWNRGYTMYRSKTMERMFGHIVDPLYGSRDPLQELIEEAHKEKIKVHAWFEFGFASSYMDTGKHILDKYPQWAAIGPDKKRVEKNGFTWMNGLSTEVQQFMTGMILEVINNYDVDGIQGDDRLPASPSLIGYDDSTVAAYRREHQGNTPPPDHYDPGWVQWRADRLNKYGEELYKTIKAAKPGIIVSMAPSVYPWSLKEYLQDWPAWLRGGYVDYVVVQLYRNTIETYEKTLQEEIKWAGEKSNRMYAGVLLSLGDGFLTEAGMLRKITDMNRKYQVPGEVFFYYEGILRHKDFFKSYQKKYHKKDAYSQHHISHK